MQMQNESTKRSKTAAKWRRIIEVSFLRGIFISFSTTGKVEGWWFGWLCPWTWTCNLHWGLNLELHHQHQPPLFGWPLHSLLVAVL